MVLIHQQLTVKNKLLGSQKKSFSPTTHTNHVYMRLHCSVTAVRTRIISYAAPSKNKVTKNFKWLNQD